MCFKWISEQSAIISRRHFELVGFIAEAESVYCAVRSLSIIQVDLSDYSTKNATSHRLHLLSS
jgi:hypothetical protein